MPPEEFANLSFRELYNEGFVQWRDYADKKKVKSRRWIAANIKQRSAHSVSSQRQRAR
jgi:hypothetical protein